MRNHSLIVIGVLACTLSVVAQSPKPPARWTVERANAWYQKQPWLVGANYIPATAINQLEMWQAETFDPQRIDLELGWAESIGMNTMRVFLHDLLWQQDQAGFRKRIDTFLTICARHHIRPLFVLFDSCWDPNPKLGTQHSPTPGIHNSGWVQSPGVEALRDPAQYPRLETYVKGIVGAYGKDPRVLAWDLWNEPNNGAGDNYKDDVGKFDATVLLLPKLFAWARSTRPIQPLTSGPWDGADWSSLEKFGPVQKIQIEQSDVISFHNYGDPADFEKHVRWLLAYKRPILCTEYMARGNKSTFQGSMPLAKKYKVAAINWGLVAGKTQTYLPWDSWKQPYTDREPAIWFHEVFKTDGTPYRKEETEFIRAITR